MPMLCCSPDFTQLDPELLNAEIEREKRMIENKIGTLRA